MYQRDTSGNEAVTISVCGAGLDCPIVYQGSDIRIGETSLPWEDVVDADYFTVDDGLLEVTLGDLLDELETRKVDSGLSVLDALVKLRNEYEDDGGRRLVNGARLDQAEREVNRLREVIHNIAGSLGAAVKVAREADVHAG